ncbi:MAG: polyvinylalcohol dehydrogenase [Planctomycetota bacterium]|nr:MAG: polyvinylalcohol dehydrogenase [Planctomycetota bacterium]
MKTRILTVVVCLTCLTALAADWPQWRGPNRDGVSAETQLLSTWPTEGPTLVWQAKDLGEGYSTPAVVGDRIYMNSNEGMDDEYVMCLSARDAKQVWRTRIGKVGPNRGPQYPGARSTPTVDGALLYTLGSDGDLACVETETGEIRWSKNLQEEFGGKPGKWAYSESPLVDGDVVVCTPGGSEATLLALDKKTGEVAWKCPIAEGDEAAYASIIIVEGPGPKQYVQFLQKGLVGVDAKTGKFLWRYDRTAKGSPANIPTPVANDGLVYSATGRGGGGTVRLSADGDEVEAEQVYFDVKLPKSIGGAVLVDGHLYGTNSGGLMCVDFASGEIKWESRGVGAGSVLAADGRLYVHGENGDVALVEITPEAYNEKGQFTLPDQPDRGRAKAWTYPVIAGGKLYLRDFGTMWCYDISDNEDFGPTSSRPRR